MRFFVNALLVLATVGVLAGLFPVSQSLGQYHAMRAEAAAKQAAKPHALRSATVR